MQKKLKIGVNGRFFCQPYTGVGCYVLGILPELARQNPKWEIVIAVPSTPPQWVMEKMAGLDNIRFELIVESGLLRRLHSGLAKAYWEKYQLGRLWVREKIDLLHLPYPALFRAPNRCPVVMTAHDAIPWDDSEYGRRNALSALYNRATLRAAACCDQLITVSRAAADEIERLPRVAGPLEVIHLSGELPDGGEMEAEIAGMMWARLGIDAETPYLFYMGGYDKRKNVTRLVRIFLQQIAPHSSLKLLLGGNAVLQNSLFERPDYADSPYADRVIPTGFLPGTEVRLLLKSARAYFSLTKREGFNLPLLEALTAGCPALVSDLPVHREVADKDIPVFLDLQSSDGEIATQVLTLLNDKNAYNKWRKDCHSASTTFSSHYSWAKSARLLGKVYEKFLK